MNRRYIGALSSATKSQRTLKNGMSMTKPSHFPPRRAAEEARTIFLLREAQTVSLACSSLTAYSLIRRRNSIGKQIEQTK